MGVSHQCVTLSTLLSADLKLSEIEHLFTVENPKFKIFFFFLWNWSLNSGLCTCKAGALPLEPHLQSILLCLFWRWGLANFLSSLASNHYPPNPRLPSS
jgi:hypothetical protein